MSDRTTNTPAEGPGENPQLRHAEDAREYSQADRATDDARDALPSKEQQAPEGEDGEEPKEQGSVNDPI